MGGYVFCGETVHIGDESVSVVCEIHRCCEINFSAG